MSVLIVGNVVASSVNMGTRRIGILKAVGFTPAQVVRAYVGRALIPAAVGTAARYPRRPPARRARTGRDRGGLRRLVPGHRPPGST
ncbi:FtsX-like permease family protein [Streptomyces nojiriensis]|uniref:FtsX-like permease family protein n=1 Tax=Streptomyces nojiriensis TaxID=66374 RepID=UPI002E17AF52